MKRILMVCMGNICRSPTAQVVADNLAGRLGLSARLQVDSAGTHAFHQGERPDPRAISVLKARGYAIAKHKSRKVILKDFERYDLILAMDSRNVEDLRLLCPAELHHKIKLLLSFDPASPEVDVPDPYFGSVAGFEHVLNLCERAIPALLTQLTSSP